MFLFLDTETTGFKKKGAIIQEGQARVCQLAMLMTDEHGKSLSEVSFLIQPTDWVISEGAAKIHGFGNELCEQYGVNGRAAYDLFKKLASMCKTVVAHNVGFDRGMMEVEAAYNKFDEVPQDWFCTMLATMDICKLPGRYGKYKWPKLEEAYQQICGKQLGENAHDAMWDTRACKDIFFELLKQGKITEEMINGQKKVA